MYQPQLIEVDPHRIKFNTKNPRKHQGAEFERLKQSVKAVGVVQLPTVRVLPGGFYEVIDGEGRVLSAQEARSPHIWAVSLGQVDDQEALTMLQSANSVRSFSFFAECRGLANLHRQGQTIDSIAKQVGRSRKTLQTYVAVGYFPDDLIDMMQREVMQKDSETEGDRQSPWTTYGYHVLQALLPLRQQIKEERPAYVGSLDGFYDYTEIRRAVERIVTGEIASFDQLKAYVEARRRELFEQRFNEEMQKRLESELARTKQALEESYSQQLQGIQAQTAERYEAQVAVLRQQYEDLERQYKKLVTDVAKRPEIIAQREEELKRKLTDAERERERFQSLQQQVQSEVQKTQAEARAAIQRELSEAVKEQRKAMDQQLAQARADMEAFYAQKDQGRQLQAEKSVRQTVAHGTELLSQTQQWILHLTSPGFVKGVSWLPDTEIGSLLAQIMAVQQTLVEALEAIRGGMITVVEERKTEERSTVYGSQG